MKIQCDHCRSVYTVDASKIPDQGAYVRCKRCQNRFHIQKESKKENKETKNTGKVFEDEPKERNQEDVSSNDVEDIVCSKCGQRQPGFRDTCFNCGFDFKQGKSRIDGGFLTSNSITSKFSRLDSKLKMLVTFGILPVGIACLFGLYLIVNTGLSWLSGDVTSIPVNEASYTNVQYNQNFVSWLKECLWKDYKNFGHHSPQWDSKVKSVLDKYALYRLGFYDEEYGFDIQTDLQSIIHSGCKDPRLYYILGNVMFRNGGNIERAEVIVGTALNDLENSPYPSLFLYYAANRLIRIYEKSGYDDSAIEPLYEKKMRYLAQAAADKRFRNGNQRYYFDIFKYQFEYIWGGDPPRGLEQFMEEFNSLEDVDPWIDSMVRGKYHITKGWEARGDEYAYKVSEEGWDVFHQEMSKAAEYLTQAHEMHHEFPEAASLMIHIRMTSNGPLNEKEWFLRAVKAQFDYDKAYTTYLQALRPRWGGSHEAMMKFGNACLKTKRFDTSVPRKFLETLKVISEDYPPGGGWVKPFRKRGVYKKVRKYFESALHAPKEGFDYFREYSAYALYAWICGEYEDAKRIKRELGENFIPEVSEEVDIKPMEFLNHLSST